MAEPGKWILRTFLLFLSIGITGCSVDDFPVGSPERLADGLSERLSGGVGRDGEESSRGGNPASEPKESEVLIYTRSYYAYAVRTPHDPFEPLLIEGGTAEGLTLNTLILTGILWDKVESMIVLEDSRGRGYPMRVGDWLAGAQLVAIREDAAVFQVVEFGEVHSVVKELFVGEESPL